jgi:hypothetical protein
MIAATLTPVLQVSLFTSFQWMRPNYMFADSHVHKHSYTRTFSSSTDRSSSRLRTRPKLACSRAYSVESFLCSRLKSRVRGKAPTRSSVVGRVSDGSAHHNLGGDGCLLHADLHQVSISPTAPKTRVFPLVRIDASTVFTPIEMFATYRTFDDITSL